VGKKVIHLTFISSNKRKRIVYIHVTQQLSELKSLGNKIIIQKTPILEVPGLPTGHKKAINTVGEKYQLPSICYGIKYGASS
jgi:hypothetical protein